jgi:hypothetical protein
MAAPSAVRLKARVDVFPVRFQGDESFFKRRRRFGLMRVYDDWSSQELRCLLEARIRAP